MNFIDNDHQNLLLEIEPVIADEQLALDEEYQLEQGINDLFSNPQTKERLDEYIDVIQMKEQQNINEIVNYILFNPEVSSQLDNYTLTEQCDVLSTNLVNPKCDEVRRNVGR